MEVTSDETAIAKVLAAYSFGSYGSSTTLTGSYWNPDRLEMNCVLVCLGFILDRTSNQLSQKAAIPQPPNGYRTWNEIENLLRRLQQVQLVREYVMTKEPFKYGRYIGPGGQLVLYNRPLLKGQLKPTKHCVHVSGHQEVYIFNDFQHNKGGTTDPAAHNVTEEFQFQSGPRKGEWDFSVIDYTVKVIPYRAGSSREANVI